MVDLRGIPTNSFNNKLYPSFRLSRLWTLFARRNELGAELQDSTLQNSGDRSYIKVMDSTGERGTKQNGAEKSRTGQFRTGNTVQDNLEQGRAI